MKFGKDFKKSNRPNQNLFDFIFIILKFKVCLNFYQIETINTF